MGNKAVFCIVHSEAQASQIINQLREAGFANNDISALLPDKTGIKDFAHEHHTKAPEGATTGGVIGGILFGSLGWMAGIGMLAVPGLGALVAAGPLMSALSSAAVGAAAGGVIGALVGSGLPEYEARRYEGKIREGNILISVHCEKDGAAHRAKEIFENADAADIATRGEAAVKSNRRPAVEPMTHAG
jgi:hypothetical protein